MNVKKFVYGIYPRNDRLRFSIGKYEKGLMNAEELQRIIIEEKEDFYRMMKEEGIDYFTDPLFNWHDIFRPISGSIKGMTIGPLTRFFETNTFYRKPLIKEINSLNDIFNSREIDEYELPYPAYSLIDSVNYVLFLPGLGTFFKLSESSLAWDTFSKKMMDIYDEIIKKSGAKIIFFYEEVPIDLAIYESFKEKIILKIPSNIDKKQLGHISAFSLIGPDPYLISNNCDIPGVPLFKSKTTLIEKGILDALKSYSADFPEILLTHDDYLDFLPRKIADIKVREMGGIK